VAQKPPDVDHPYGHRKFETLAAAIIAAFLMLVLVEIGQAALVRLRHGGAPHITSGAFVVMIGTVCSIFTGIVVSRVLFDLWVRALGKRVRFNMG
jgi:divalent metal cation (Fe/Co/Zn/Cd) transporter